MSASPVRPDRCIVQLALAQLAADGLSLLTVAASVGCSPPLAPPQTWISMLQRRQGYGYCAAPDAIIMADCGLMSITQLTLPLSSAWLALSEVEQSAKLHVGFVAAVHLALLILLIYAGAMTASPETSRQLADLALLTCTTSLASDCLPACLAQLLLRECLSHHCCGSFAGLQHAPLAMCMHLLSWHVMQPADL